MIIVRCRGRADELADAREGAWLRVWTQTLLLGFLTNRPLPLVPDALRSAWAGWDAGVRDAALEIICERAVASRAAALRACYPAHVLTSVLTGVARDLLGGRAAPTRAGQAWVPPQLRWAHEADRAGWMRPAPDPAIGPGRPGCPGAAPGPRSAAARYGAFGPVAGWELAPPLDFALAGLPDWPGIRIADRLALLLRHPLALSEPRNRELAVTALFGADGREAFDADVVVLDAGGAAADAADTERILTQAARMMDLPGDWLVTVLRWAASR